MSQLAVETVTDTFAFRSEGADDVDNLGGSVTTPRPRSPSRAERARLLELAGPNPTPYPTEPAHILFDRVAHRQPSVTAAVCGDRALTYEQLEQATNRLANYLVRRGVDRGSRVAIYLDRSLDMLVAVLAVLKAGAAYVPLDPAFPADRLRHMLADADPRLVVTSAKLKAGLPSDTPIILSDNDREAIDAEPSTPPSTGQVEENDLAYVIYTSGSTGVPKGVGMDARVPV